MEELAKKRRPIRGSFTRNLNDLIEELSKETPDVETVETKWARLEDLFLRIKELDNEILSVIKADKEYDIEYADIEKYEEKMNLAKVKTQKFFSNRVTLGNASGSNNPSPKFNERKLKLPKIELKQFGGDVKDWLTFWGQFKRIHEDKLMENEDKFHYLFQATIKGTRARDIVESFPATSENYEKVIECLKARFGREELLIEFYVRELLTLVIKNATENKRTTNIAVLYDKLESFLRALESIGMKSDKYAAMLFPLVESCIPEEILRVWLRNHAAINSQESSYCEKLKQLLFFLRNEVEGEQRISLAKSGFKIFESASRRDKKYQNGNSLPTANDLFSGEKRAIKLSENKICIFCEKQHESKDCFLAPKMPLAQKQEIIKSKRVCYVCFKVGHRAKHCKTSVRCIICSNRHWAVMCSELAANQDKENKTLDNEKQNVAIANCDSAEVSNTVYLQTLMVNIGDKGRNRTIRALIDTGSQRSYILKATADQLKLKPVGSESLTHIVFGGNVSKREHNRYSLDVKDLQNYYSCRLEVLDQPTICGSVPRIKRDFFKSELKAKGIKLSDVGMNVPEIELLIGADFAGKLYTGKTHKLKCGLIAVQTHFGWSIMGRRENFTEGSRFTSLLIQSTDITNIWKLETIGISDPAETESSGELERRAIDHFSSTVTTNKEGRYEIQLPWIQNLDELPSNREMAGIRLMASTIKLEKGANYESYNSVFGEWYKEGVIENSGEGPGHYLPHRGVFKANSTTAVRPVFDASCKTRGNLSLNDCLMKGPNLLEIIPSVLLKFREKEIGVISDIKKAFLQISVSEEDRKYLKFLWWEDRLKKITKVFQHCRVVFGLNCSPFLLGAVIQHHLNQYQDSPAQDVAVKLRNSFYVDNCVTSVDSEQELERFMKYSSEMMADAKFELRGWAFTDKTKLCEEPQISPVLGLLWSRSEDVLFCDSQAIEMPEGIVTRRVMLSLAHRVFDPIGFTCPVTLRPKFLLQESWRSKSSWDSEVPNNIKENFLKWVEDMQKISIVKIPRKAFPKGNCHLQLHTFCDASGKSYAAAVFLRGQTDCETVVQLLMAKSRIAPLKEISIPRLELLACCIGTRLTEFVKKSLNFGNVETYFWTDSTTALQWIKTDESWGTFVRNRVREIKKLSNIENWRHVPGKLNPADLPSRGCTVQKLLVSRWWEGPSWLKLEKETWPQSTSLIDEEEVFKEKSRKTVNLISNCMDENNLFFYFSNYTKNVRMVGWIFRFINNAKKQGGMREKGKLTVSEVTNAEKRIIKIIQNEVLTEEYIKGLKSLNIFRDEEGIFRVKTKLTEKNDTRDFRFPVILPGKHRLVELLIRETHLKMMHAGLQILLAGLREKFWIVNGRKAVRSVINGCMRCKRYSAKCVDTQPVSLPSDRIEEEVSVFEIIGVDLAGPLNLKEGGKAWIVLYTCAVYRAIHLELILSLSTKAFLLSLRRFIARRGRPKIIYSDHGKNFIGSENMFQSLDWETIESEASNIYRIEWNFIPPSAPWWGGFWERMVQMVKRILRRVLGNASVYYEEMNSILCDCESVINSRPLTYLSEDPEDLIPLTPAMFLQNNPTVGVPDLDHLDRINISKRWQYQQTLRERLRKRFRLEYLGILNQPREKGNYYNLKVGDVVLIESDSKRILWPMAKVVEIYPGKDGNIRVVRLKTSKGEIIRPVKRIYPLEISSCSSNTAGSQGELRRICNQNKTTRSGRTIRLPVKFRDT